MRRIFNTLEINGIMQSLRRRGRDIEQAAKIALRESAEEITRTAKFLAPVRTGNLQNSIHWTEEENGLIYKIVADAKNQKGESYAKIVEYSPKINKPFMYPAIAKVKARINEKIKAAVTRRIH